MRDKKTVIASLEVCGTGGDCLDGCLYENDRSAGKIARCMENLMTDALEIIKKQDDDLAAMQCALDKANEKLGYVNPDYFYDLELGREQLKAWYECWRYEEMERVKPMLVREVEGQYFSHLKDYFCPTPNCNKRLSSRKNTLIHYCPYCGQAVKWE